MTYIESFFGSRVSLIKKKKEKIWFVYQATKLEIIDREYNQWKRHIKYWKYLFLLIVGAWVWAKGSHRIMWETMSRRPQWQTLRDVLHSLLHLILTQSLESKDDCPHFTNEEHMSLRENKSHIKIPEVQSDRF